MLRIHFTPEDLGRTRVATTPDPLWESMLSLHRLRARDGALVFGQWRARVRGQLATAPVRPQLRMLLPLVPQHGYFPDFLTPADARAGWQAGIDALLHTPATRLRAELELLAGRRRLPTWARGLAEGDPGLLRRLATALTAYYELAVAPFGAALQAQLDADRALRARSLLDGGAEGLLDSLRPLMRWQNPVLEVDYPREQELHLDGRGLLLVPSFFCWRHPISLLDPTQPPVLVYPVEKDPAWFGGPQVTTEPAVAALLGTTRAAVLATVGIGCTTGELARRLRISPASASQHTTVLRNAGLITSRRNGPVVLHTQTPLGAQLLRP